MVVCKNCGQQMFEEENFCPKCGGQQTISTIEYNQTVQQKQMNQIQNNQMNQSYMYFYMQKQQEYNDVENKINSKKDIIKIKHLISTLIIVLMIVIEVIIYNSEVAPIQEDKERYLDLFPSYASNINTDYWDEKMEEPIATMVGVGFVIFLIAAGVDISAGADVRAKKRLIKKKKALQSEIEMYKQNMMAQGMFTPM